MAFRQLLGIQAMWCEVTKLRQRGKRLHRHGWPEAILVDLQIEQLHGPANPFRQHTRMASLWLATSTSNQRGMGTIFDPVLLRTPGDGFLVRGIELETIDGRLHEFQQVWLCRPSSQGAGALPLFAAEPSLNG
jgi:hypothetical protein